MNIESLYRYRETKSIFFQCIDIIGDSVIERWVIEACETLLLVCPAFCLADEAYGIS